MARPSHGKAFPWKGLLIGKVSQGQGFYSSHGLVLIPCVVPHDLGGVSSGFSWAGFSLQRFVIGKASHGKAFPWQGLPMARPSHGKASPWQGLPMARPSHGKAFPWKGLLIGKVSQGQGFYSSHGLVLIPCVVPHDLGGVSSGFSWAGFSLERFVIGKASHGEAFPWEGLPMGRPFPWEGLPMG